MEFSAEEEDAVSEVGEVFEASGSVFELLDFAVEAFAHGVGDPLAEVADDPRPMFLEPLSHLDDRIEPAANGPGVPTLEVAGRLLFAGTLPEPAEELLDAQST